VGGDAGTLAVTPFAVGGDASVAVVTPSAMKVDTGIVAVTPWAVGIDAVVAAVTPLRVVDNDDTSSAMTSFALLTARGVAGLGREEAGGGATMGACLEVVAGDLAKVSS